LKAQLHPIWLLILLITGHLEDKMLNIMLTYHIILSYFIILIHKLKRINDSLLYINALTLSKMASFYRIFVVVALTASAFKHF
jgi:hypothetical protein